MPPDISTPPYRPTYGVRLSELQLEAIIAAVLPGRRLVYSAELPKGKSFNNRIYFLDVESLSATTPSETFPYVLRVCGHFFGTRKVHNEVGWLLRLKHDCPSVPVPEVVAGSAEGTTIETTDYGFLDLREQQDAISKHGWVLQTRLPGRILTVTDLDGLHGSAILRQLAEYLSTWRTKISSGGAIGNMSLISLEKGKTSVWQPPHSSFQQNRGFVASGLLLTDRQSTPSQFRSWPTYYQFLLEDKYERMMEWPQLKSLKKMTQRDVEDLLKFLPSLPFLKDRFDTKFTHMDFAPRNILISDTTNPPQVTGILDFEFSAFLPSPSEFLNSLVNQPGDWPSNHYQTFLAHLKAIENKPPYTSSTADAVCVPHTEAPESKCLNEDQCECGYHNFQNLSRLESVIANVAPWYIMPNSHIGKDDELQAECDKAAAIVLDGVYRLRKLLSPSMLS